MASYQYTHRKTLDEDRNKFAFVCPIFNVETPIAACLKLRDLVWKGDRPVVRRGCQVCMRASKCPIPHIMADMRNYNIDPYHSDTPVVGRLSGDLLKTIAPISVTEGLLKEYALTDREIELIQQANEDARNGVQKRQARKAKAGKAEEVKDEPPSVETEAPAEDKTVEAAMTGNLAAAINAEMKNTSSEPRRSTALRSASGDGPGGVSEPPAGAPDIEIPSFLKRSGDKNAS